MAIPSLRAVDRSGLKPVAGRPPFLGYLAAIFSRRHYIVAEARAKSRSRNRGMLLGNGWLILSPLLDAAVYILIFGLILNTSRGIEHYIAYVLIGTTFFGFTNRCFTGSLGLMSVRKNFIKAFSFPRGSLVVSHGLKLLFDALPSIIVLLFLLYFPSRGLFPTWSLLFVPVMLVLQWLFNLGLMFFGAWVTSIVPDLKQIFTYCTRIWFYGSGIFYSIDVMLAQHPELLRWAHLNPMYLFLTAYRDALISGRVPNTTCWLGMIAWAAGAFVIGILLFWTREVKYGRG